MFTDFVLNGEAHGEVGSRFAGCHYDPGMLRPFRGSDGRVLYTINTGRTKIDKETGKEVPIYENVRAIDLMDRGLPVANATLALRKDEWIQLDNKVISAYRSRLRAWEDVSRANSYGGFNAMAKPILEHEVTDDPGEAIVDMDGISEGRRDVPRFQLRGIPLPITHSSFSYSARKLAVSRNMGTPLDLRSAEFAGRRIAEMIEKTLIGTVTGLQYGVAADYDQTPQVEGYLTHPSRITKTDMTTPTSSNGTTQLSEWLTVRDLLFDAKAYGPYIVYTSTDYDEILDNDFKTNSDKSIRQRLLEIEGVQAIRRLDFLTNTFTTIWVQMNSETVQAINGMEPTVVQWESRGGMQLNFKVMAIQVPRIRDDFNGNMGLAVTSTS